VLGRSRRGRGRSAESGHGVEPPEWIEGQVGEWRGRGQVQQPAAAGAGVAGRDRKQPQAQPFGLPPAGVMAGQGQGLHPGEQVAGECHDGAPDLVLRKVVQRQVGQPGVLGGADAVLGAGPVAVA
jgi:hypothetical protein